MEYNRKPWREGKTDGWSFGNGVEFYIPYMIMVWPDRLRFCRRIIILPVLSSTHDGSGEFPLSLKWQVNAGKRHVLSKMMTSVFTIMNVLQSGSINI